MYIGIDLGGTNIAAALVDEDGVIKKRANIPTAAKSGAEVVLDRLLHVCETLTADEAAPQSIGIGVPGTVNDMTGEVIFTPNLPLSGINIISGLQKKYACPIHVGNDANCAALGEITVGGAKGAHDAVLITLGTGIGGGIVLNGHLHTGAYGAAGELGHMVIIAGGRMCGCGRHGCWETYASASGLIRTASDVMETHKESLLWELCGGQTGEINGRIVFEAYRTGDRAAKLIVEQYIEHLAAGIANIINILEPEMICVGGGISNAWDCLAELLHAAVDAERFARHSPQSPHTSLVKATLGNDAGIIGAALLHM